MEPVLDSDHFGTKNEAVTPVALEYFRSQSGWMRFCAITYIVLLTVGALLLIPAMGTFIRIMERNGEIPEIPVEAIYVSFACLLILMILGILYAFRMLKTSRSLKTFTETSASSDFEEYAYSWFVQLKFQGILTVGVMAFLAVAVVLIAVILSSGTIPF